MTLSPASPDTGAARDAFATARARIAAVQEAGAPGRDLARMYALAVDRAILALPGADPGPGFAVVAAGGYGRKEVCPGSDVDLLLLGGDPADPAFEGWVRGVLYPLYDLGLRVGHHPGTPRDLLSRAEGDVPTRTALLDARFLTGDRALFEGLRSGIRERLPAWGEDLRVQAVAASRARFRRYGGSVFLQEPHVKEGMGGLRDWHWVLWLSRAISGARGPGDLLLAGLTDPRDLADMLAALDFELRVRIGLHLLQGRREDRLSFDLQAPLARRLGYKASRLGTAQERLMGAWYHHASRMAWATARLVKRLTGQWWDESEGSPPGTVEEEGPFRLEDGEVRVTGTLAAPGDPLPLLDLFRFQQHHGGRLHPDTEDEVRARAPKAAARLRRDPEVAARFRELLGGPRRFPTLRAMYRSGVLVRLIPELSRTYCKAQGSRMHLYTVDVHSLRAVRELDSLAEPGTRERHPFHAALYDREGRRPSLALAVLLHDIGKAWPDGNHSRKGAEMAEPVARRLGFAEDEVAEVVALIRHHLLLNEVALRRDLSDPATVTAFTELVGTPEALDRLFLLTFADMQATHPDLLTRWKETLQQDLYHRARAAMTGAPPPAASPRRVAQEARALLSQEGSGRRADVLLAHLLDGLPADFASRHGPETLAACAGLLDPARDEAVRVHRRPSGRGWSEVAVVTRDRPGLFADLAGTLAAHGLDVLGAEVHTRPDGWILDLFQVTGPGRSPEIPDPRFRRFVADLERVLSGGERAMDLLRRLRRPVPAPAGGGADTRVGVEFPERAAGGSTVVEVTAPDRPGILHEIARCLFEQRLTIDLARIATSGPLAVDAFYVRDARTGRGALSERRRKRLRGALVSSLEGVPP
ncbi:[protein-PII] uridylyltransferase [Myxococcota bacterium]|nr:[protein-PII] uridylyltransferase [Myxococcota bacterium]